MSVFHYLIKDLEGKRKEGEIRADTLDLAIEKEKGKRLRTNQLDCNNNFGDE